jgi:hypothetical protein
MLQLSDTSAYRHHVSDEGFRRSSLVAARDLFERVEERGEVAPFIAEPGGLAR